MTSGAHLRAAGIRSTAMPATPAKPAHRIRGELAPVGVRQGHYSMVARMVRDFELSAERITDLDEIPIDLLARFARALNRAERNALARVQTIEEATD